MVAQVDQARVLLQTPLGIAGSARLRYGAAMTLYQAGQISAEGLKRKPPRVGGLLAGRVWAWT